ncbi:MAG: threonine ammonia-lyase [Planctomycetaceae bacterium]|nr:threonine ammonia-lyase [Planctomycetaceae bacterium]
MSQLPTPGGSGSSGTGSATAPRPSAAAQRARLDEIPIDAIRRAADVIGPHIVRTPTVLSHAFSQELGAEVHFKLEILQRTGSFKVRGALHRILTLETKERARGVIAASAGNHAQGVGLAAQLCGCPATIVMPVGTPQIKVRRTAAYGAEVVLFGDNYDRAYAHARELAQQRGLVMIHPFDDPAVIAGQGTIGLEMLEQLADFDTVVVPIGGGGLIAGIALALKALAPAVRIVGVQAAGAAPMVHSFAAGAPVEVAEPRTIADGIRVGKVGGHTWPIVRDLVDECVAVEEEELALAIAGALEQSKIVLEGAGAAGLAALLSRRVQPGKRTVVLACGGNIDLTLLARVVELGLAHAGRTHRMRLRVPDRPGQLEHIGAVLRREGANILDIQHHRGGWRVPLGFVDVELLVETRGPEALAELEAALAKAGLDTAG